MHDYQMIHLAADRQHQFQREAAATRLARQVPAQRTQRHRQPATASAPRNALRLTLDLFLGRGSM